MNDPTTLDQWKRAAFRWEAIVRSQDKQIDRLKSKLKLAERKAWMYDELCK